MLDHNDKFISDGDFNSLSHNSLTQTGLQSIYNGPTHKGNNFDKLYGINIDPKLFNPNTYVSHIKTHHLGVIALPLNIAPSHDNITRSIHTYHRGHSNQHKACLDYLSSSSFNPTYDNITESVDSFYTTVDSIFNKFYPLKQITIKSSDPPFINPFVKSLLCQKNCLMRKGIQSLLNKLIRLNYLPPNYPKIKSIFASLDERLFSRVTTNSHHVLHQILPPVKSTPRDMRRRTHNYTKTIYSSFQDKTFLPRLLNTQ